MKDRRLIPLAATVWLAAIVVPALPLLVSTITVVSLAVVVIVAAAFFLAPSRSRPSPNGYQVDPSRRVPPRHRRSRRHAWFRRHGLALLVVLLGAVFGTAVTSLHVLAARAGPVASLARQFAVVTVDLGVRTDPKPHADKKGPRYLRAPYVVFDAEVLMIKGRGERTRVHTPVVVVAGTKWANVQPGQVVRAVARLAPTDSADRASALVSARSPPEVVDEPGVLDRAASWLRGGLRAAAAPLPRDAGGLLPALVVGDVARLPTDVADDMRAAGLSHLSAVSGTNLTIMLWFVVGMAKRLTARRGGLRIWTAPLLGLATVAGFVLLARPEPSVLRAAAMGLVAVVGLAAGSERKGLPAMAIAVTALLLWDPWLGRTFGFALSVAATTGILLLGRTCTDILARRIEPRLPSWFGRKAFGRGLSGNRSSGGTPPGDAALGAAGSPASKPDGEQDELQSTIAQGIAAAIAIPIAAQLACTPVAVLLSGQVSVGSILANALTGPVVEVATVLGVAATIVAAISVPVASVLAWLAFPVVWWIVQVARFTARLPGANLDWPANPIAIGMLAAACLAAGILLPKLLRRRALLVVLTAAILLWLVHPIRPVLPSWISAWPPAGWVLVACDIGQGDGLVLRAGPHTGVVVDTGPDPDLMDRCLSTLDIRRVPYVLLTHFHADHIDGLPGVLRGREVAEVGTRPLDAPAGSERFVQESVKQANAGRSTSEHVLVRQAARGERRKAGDISWTVLAPIHPTTAGAGNEDGEGSAENDASVVVMAEVAGVRILLTGDVEPPSQQAILESGADLRADVFKVPHHGSRAQDAEFMASTGARIALISCGIDNDYGHPAPATLRALKNTGALVARTDLDGAVAVVKDPNGLFLVRQKSSPDVDRTSRSGP